jgi:hypothetical protein
LHDLTRVLEHDGAHLAELATEIKVDIVDLSYTTAAKLIALTAPELDDPQAVAVLVLGPLVAFRRTAWTFGNAPLDLDDARLLAAWTDLTIVTLTR